MCWIEANVPPRQGEKYKRASRNISAIPKPTSHSGPAPRHLRTQMKLILVVITVLPAFGRGFPQWAMPDRGEWILSMAFSDWVVRTGEGERFRINCRRRTHPAVLTKMK